MKAVLPAAMLLTLLSSACKPKIQMPNPTLAEQTTPVTPEVSKPESFIGLTFEQAKKTADAAGVRHRVIEEDGISKPVTRDYDPVRLNFVLEKGIITKVSLG